MWRFLRAASLLANARGSILGFAVRLAYDATLVNCADLILVDLRIEVATMTA
jgi:hypothetical protein